MLNTFHYISFLQLPQCSVDKSLMAVLEQPRELLRPELLEVGLQLAEDQLNGIVSTKIYVLSACNIPWKRAITTMAVPNTFKLLRFP